MKKTSQIIFIFLSLFYFNLASATTVWTCQTINGTSLSFASEELCTTGGGCKTECKESGTPEEVDPIEDTEEGTAGDTSDRYNLLAPIKEAGLDYVSYDPESDKFVGDYLNKLFLLAIGIISAIAVVMLIVSGIKYMGQDSIFGKGKAKEQITNSILGLLIAIGAFAILNTISPDLIGNKGLFIKQVSIDLPDSGDGSTDSKCNTGDGTYETSTPVNPEVTNTINKIKNDGWAIDSFEVSSSENKFIIILKKENQYLKYKTSMLPGVGSGGYSYAEIGKGKVGDKKTPKGNWDIVSIKTEGNNKPVYNQSCSNMGASFWLLNPKQENGEYRGIGIHGNKKGTLTKTNGCIRLTNSDILALLPYVKTGMSVKIN